MRAITIPAHGDNSVLTLADIPTPEPGPGEVRVRVEAAGVNPADAWIREGGLSEYSPQRLPLVVAGWELAGVVDALGEGVTGWAVGAPVIALTDWASASIGTHAEQVVLPASQLAPRPQTVAVSVAATVPLNALTAWQALDLLDVAPGSTVIVTGAAGAVGAFAVQLAVARGLRTIALAGADDEKTVSRHGAEVFVPRDDDPAAALRLAAPQGVHGIVDAALLGESIVDLVRPGGTFAGLTPPSTPAARPGLASHTLNVHGDGVTLTEIIGRVSRGELIPREVETYPFEQAPAAYARLATGGRRTGLALVF